MSALIQGCVSLIVLASRAASQSLLAAIAGYPALSDFTALLRDNPELADALLTSSRPSLTGPTTVLVPNNGAFLKESTFWGLPYGKLTIQQLEPYLEYHLLAGKVTSLNLTSDEGITVPTYLSGETYNNRSAGAALGSNGSNSDPHNGQVVILKPNTGLEAYNGTVSIRQVLNQNITAQGGFVDTINVTATDGQWAGGYFQVVDSFLTLPYNCSETFRRCNQSALLHALNRTGLTTTLNMTQNITCLGPTDDAFLSAGSPETKANITDLESALLFHTLSVPVYSTFLEDGMTFKSYSNATIRVKIVGDDIFFNDAKVVQPNVITNNGLMHVLDRVMSPLRSNVTSSSGNSATTTSLRGPLRRGVQQILRLLLQLRVHLLLAQCQWSLFGGRLGYGRCLRI